MLFTVFFCEFKGIDLLLLIIFISFITILWCFVVIYWVTERLSAPPSTNITTTFTNSLYLETGLTGHNSRKMGWLT